MTQNVTDQASAGNGSASPSGRAKRNVASIVLVIAIALALEIYFWRTLAIDSLTPLRAIGLALALSGFVLWGIARIQLGKSFAVRAKAQTLVTRGIYSKIRNPIYVFGTVCIAGVLLSLGQEKWLLILVLLIPMQLVRARKEARVLEEKFGDEYRDYRRSTWF